MAEEKAKEKIIKEGIVKLSKQFFKIIEWAEICEHILDTPALLERKSFFALLKSIFKLVKNKKFCEIAKVNSCTKHLTRLEFSDITPVRDSFIELEKVVKEAKKQQNEMINISSIYPEVTGLLGDLDSLDLIDRGITIAIYKVRLGIGQERELNTVITRYIYKFLKNFENWKIILKAQARCLAKVGKSSLDSLNYSNLKKTKALESFIFAIEDIALHFRNYRPSTDLCADYDSLSKLYWLRFEVKRVRNSASHVRTLIKEPSLVDEILSTLTASLHPEKFMDLLDAPELANEATGNVTAIFNKAKERCNQLEYLTARLKIACSQEKIEAENEYESKQKTIPQTKLLDEINNKIIELYEKSQEQHIKMPSNEIIATALYENHITPKKLSREAIRKRTKKLRKEGLIGSPDDNKGIAKRCTNEHIEDLEGNGDVRKRF